MILSGLGAGALYAAAADRPQETAPAVDPAAVDQYLAQLSETVPPPVATALAREAEPQHPSVRKDAAKADKAEPVVGAAFAIAR